MPNLHPLPTDPRPALEYLISVATGQETDMREVPHAGWEVVGFGISLSDKHDAVRSSDDPELKAELVKLKDISDKYRAAHVTTGYAAVDWNALVIQLIPVVLKVIEILSRKSTT